MSEIQSNTHYPLFFFRRWYYVYWTKVFLRVFPESRKRAILPNNKIKTFWTLLLFPLILDILIQKKTQLIRKNSLLQM